MRSKLLSICILITLIGWNPISTSAQYGELEAYMDRLNELRRFNGVVLIGDKDRVVFEHAVGQADAEGNEKIKRQTSFYIGSVTKPFTATLVLQAVERGEISLFDTLASFFPRINMADEVTIRHMLSHTSGIGSYTDMSSMKRWKNRENSREEMLSRIEDLRPRFKPGERYEYSNSNYYLLGAILEEVQRKTYEEILREGILGPLGMKHSGIDPGAAQKHMAEGLSPTLQAWESVELVHLSVPFAAGAMYSNATDLHSFSQALFASELFKVPQSLELMTTTVEGNYGLGLFQLEVEGESALGHTGGIDGYSALMLFFPSSGLHFISLSNSLVSDHLDIASAAMRLHNGESIELPETRQATLLPPELLQRYAGSYSLEAGFLLDVQARQGYLTCQVPGQDVVELLAANDTAFYSEIHNLDLFFQVDSAGAAVESIRLDQAGYSFKGTPFQLPSSVLALPQKKLQRLIGVYALGPGFDLEVSLMDEKLMAQATGQDAFELIAESETRFFATVAPIDIEFDLDKTGRAKGLTLKQSGQVIYAEREGHEADE